MCQTPAAASAWFSLKAFTVQMESPPTIQRNASYAENAAYQFLGLPIFQQFHSSVTKEVRNDILVSHAIHLSKYMLPTLTLPGVYECNWMSARWSRSALKLFRTSPSVKGDARGRKPMLPHGRAVRLH